jgi:hypothetical protein
MALIQHPAKRLWPLLSIGAFCGRNESVSRPVVPRHQRLQRPPSLEPGNSPANYSPPGAARKSAATSRATRQTQDVSFLLRRRLIARFEAGDFFLELVDGAAKGAEGELGGVIVGGGGEAGYLVELFQAAQLFAGDFTL